MELMDLRGLCMAGCGSGSERPAGLVPPSNDRILVTFSPIPFRQGGGACFAKLNRRAEWDGKLLPSRMPPAN